MYMIVYALTWIATIGAAGILFVTGNFNEVAAAAFGFLFATLFFAGLVAVLPWWVDKYFAPKY